MTNENSVDAILSFIIIYYCIYDGDDESYTKNYTIGTTSSNYCSFRGPKPQVLYNVG